MPDPHWRWARERDLATTDDRRAELEDCIAKTPATTLAGVHAQLNLLAEMADVANAPSSIQRTLITNLVAAVGKLLGNGSIA